MRFDASNIPYHLGRAFGLSQARSPILGNEILMPEFPPSRPPKQGSMNPNSDIPDWAGTVPRIAPVPVWFSRPLWSVMIPVYNCAKYLRQTLESVIAQDPGPEQMQIEVVDDCSDKDDPQELINEIAQGRVLFHRKSANEGAVRNFNTCIERSRGYLVHILHGDDLVEAGFYKEFGEAFSSSPECATIFSRALIIDENGDLLGLSEFCPSLKEGSNDARDLVASNHVRAPAAVVRRCFYERYGGFDTSLVHTADWDMWLRAVVNGRARMLNRALASYRVFDASDTSRLRRSAEDLRDRLRLIEKWAAQSLPGFDRRALNHYLVSMSLADARRFQRMGDHEAAQANYRFFYENSTLRQRGHIYLERVLRKLHSLFLR
jgi:glycosyltransferase involved in cell wall biosynthesis